MSKKVRKILKNVEAKVKVSTVIILVIIATLSVTFVLMPETNVRAETEDFGNYKVITIDNTYVDETLTNFPVWVYNISVDFKDSDNSGPIQPDGDDIAFYNLDNITKYNHEIELYDGTTGEIGIWVNVTSIANDVATQFLIYYGDADGDNQENVTDTWDGNFVGVWHLKEDPAVAGAGGIVDSTINYYNGTDTGSMDADDHNVSGMAGYAMDFDGVDDFINISSGGLPADLADDAKGTIEIWLNQKDDSAVLFCTNDFSDDNDYFYFNYGLDPCVMRAHSGTANTWKPACSTTLTNGVWWYYVMDSDDTTNHFYLNSSTEAVNTWEAGSNDGTWFDATGIGQDTTVIGMLHRNEGNVAPTESTLDEIRISDISRSHAWINATYDTISSPSTFLTFGSEALSDSAFSLSGYDGSNRITWSGETGETVWSNATSYGTLNASYNVQPADNCSEMKVYVTNLSNYVFAQNITLYVSSDNINFAVLNYDAGNGNGVFPTDGGNLTVNTTTWPAADAGTDPFPLDGGAAWENGSIYFRFELAIPGGIDAGTFTKDDWLVWWKVIS